MQSNHSQMSYSRVSPIALKVDGLSKSYLLGEQGTGYDRVAEAIVASITRIFRPGRVRQTEEEQVWALRDVTFEVGRGEVVGIIGRNGAGKSTLLKILCRVTKPTSGYAEVHGSVGSLLEVGTGFHPDLTGRENVYLSGSVLGLRRDEIDHAYEEIVSFAEIDRFMDTPIKFYSSGMQVRLAFAVSAHLNPDIMFIDEVLAVGDLSFQRKCLAHLERLKARGMTILMVSHNMAAIQNACERVILLEGGRIDVFAGPSKAIPRYREILFGPQQQGSPETTTEPREALAIRGLEMLGEDGQISREFRFGERIRIRIYVDAAKRLEHPLINLGIKRSDGIIVCNFNNWYDNFKIDFIEGHCLLEGFLPPLRLIPDHYETEVLVWPWGGGHSEGDLTTASPYVSRSFGSFAVTGPGLNSHDGVFQIPAAKWRFVRSNQSYESGSISLEAIHQAFEELSEPPDQ